MGTTVSGRFPGIEGWSFGPLVLAVVFSVAACQSTESPEPVLSNTMAPSSCLGCVPCSPGASCPESYCKPTRCVESLCRPAPSPCSDADPATWDRCDESSRSCAAFLGDGLRACVTAADCKTEHPCQEFRCVERTCRPTEETRFCGDVFQRPHSCSGDKDCLREVRWAFSQPEKALVSLAGGPLCVRTEGKRGFCEWLEAPGGR